MRVDFSSSKLCAVVLTCDANRDKSWDREQTEACMDMGGTGEISPETSGPKPDTSNDVIKRG